MHEKHLSLLGAFFVKFLHINQTGINYFCIIGNIIKIRSVLYYLKQKV